MLNRSISEHLTGALGFQIIHLIIAVILSSYGELFLMVMK